jgi:hypothetical protein
MLTTSGAGALDKGNHQHTRKIMAQVKERNDYTYIRRYSSINWCCKDAPVAIYDIVDDGSEPRNGILTVIIKTESRDLHPGGHYIGQLHADQVFETYQEAIFDIVKRIDAAEAEAIAEINRLCGRRASAILQLKENYSRIRREAATV